VISDRVRLMLRAALLDDARGRAAWEQWTALPPAPLSPEERQLAPTLFQALTRRGITDSALGVFQPFAQQAWVTYHANGVVAAQVLGNLDAAGFATLVLKGAALIPTYYRDPAARRSGDIDVAVPEAALFAAWDLLEAAGWRAVGTDQRHFDARFMHAAQLVDGMGHSLDLHCHVLSMSCDAGADAPFWDAAVPFDLGSVATRMLCGTDQLLHICAHGQIWAYVQPVRWVADAALILRAETIDWTRLLRLARERRVTLFVAAALDELVRTLDVALPADVLTALRGAPTNAIDRLLFTSWSRNSNGRPIRRAQWILARFLRGTSGLGLRGRLGRVRAFMRFWLVQDSWLGLFRRLAFKAWRQLTIRLGVGDPYGPSRELLNALTQKTE
jgi:hypothetical protein